MGLKKTATAFIRVFFFVSAVIAQILPLPVSLLSRTQVFASFHYCLFFYMIQVPVCSVKYLWPTKPKVKKRKEKTYKKYFMDTD